MQIRKQRAGHKLAGSRISRLLALALFAASTASTIAADLPPLFSSIGVWGDYNKDGLMDVLLAGTIQGVASIPDGRFTRIYRNTGGGTFEALATPLPQLDNAAAAWGDFDNDGDLDLLLGGLADGTNGPVALTEIYRNDGSNQFTALNAGLQGRGQGSVAWVDYDNDGDADVFVTGLNTGTTNWATQLYRNNGNSTFTSQSANLPGLTNGVGHWGDYDNDGDADLLLGGSGTPLLIRNNGSGVFADVGFGFIGGSSIVSSWGDYDGNGGLDVFTSDCFPCPPPRLYRNDGAGILSGSLEGSINMWAASAACGDVDNSGRACVLVNGLVSFQPGLWGFAVRAYVNQGASWQEFLTLGGRTDGSVNWVDHDGDGDLDVFQTGQQFTGFWTNTVALQSDSPQSPLTPTVTFTALDEVSFSWQRPFNTPTTGRGLSYNVRVGRTSGGVDVVSPLADPATGRRLIHAVGNAGTAHLFKLNSLPPGIYFWSLQSIGQSYTGSPFTAEGTFTVTSSPPVILTQPVDQTVFAGSNVLFLVSATGTKPLSFQWRKAGVPLAEDEVFVGATSSSLSISNAQPAHAGAYDVVITNSYGAITSAVANLQVQGEPRILVQPADLNVLSNRTAAFTVIAAGGLPLSYRWLHYGLPLSDDAQTSGTTTATLSIQNVHAGYAGVYSVVVSNAWGSITSSVATLNLASFRYVNVNNPTPVSPYLTWATAATVIQDAIDVSAPGDEVVVTNGAYASGGRAVAGTMTNRVAVDRPVTLRSVNGPAATIIQGVTGPAISGIRCVYLTNGAELIGFTLTKGGTRSTGHWRDERSGGGVLCESTSVLVSNCIITASTARVHGGGAYSGTLMDCIISGNSCSQSGGGTAYSTLERCTLSGNSATWGGGAEDGVLNHCILSGNSASDPGGDRLGDGGGSFMASLTNCALVNNYARVGGGGAIWGSLVNCLVISNSALQGGGASANLLVNCTVVGNSAFSDGQVGGGVGGGVLGGIMLNSIVISNQAFFGSHNYSSSASIANSCTVPLSGGVGNIDADPLFVDYAAGNYRLQTNSPCINAGDNGPVTFTTDLDGRPRVAEGVVDIGAYEYQRPPWMILHPISQTVVVTSNVTFTASAIGDEPLTYQWQKDGVNLVNDGRISGTTTAALTVSSVIVPDGGGYRLIVTNAWGAVTSAVAVLNTTGPPTISVQPASRTAPAGTNVSFNVTATGLAALSYQWRFNQADLSGKTNSSVSLTNVQAANAGGYDVVIANIYGAITSSVATLTVLPSPPTITTQAVSLVASVGQTVSFGVAAKGSEPMTCQWQFKGADLPGGNSFTLVLTNVNASFTGSYRAAVSNSAGFAFSTNVTLVVSPVLAWGQTGQQLQNPIAPPASATNVIAIAAGKPTNAGYPCFALRADGSLVKWGGSLPTPADVTNVTALSAGGPGLRAGENNLALLADGTLVHWTVTGKQTVVTNGNFVGVAAGGWHQLALRDDGTVLAWGSNASGQTNVPASATNVIAIAAGTSNSVALRADGSVVQWGFGPTDTFGNATGVIAISAGGDQSLALLAEGAVTGWTVTNYGFPSPVYGAPPINASNVAAISAGAFHSLAVRRDGTVIGWGYTNGQTTIPPQATNALAVAAGNYHSLALVRDPFAPPIPPRIARPPLSRSVFAGQSAVFNALAVGGLPLSSQWLRNGAPLAGQTNQWLAFSTVQLSDAGNYQLVVTNESGSVTSAVLSVTVIIPPPVLHSLQVGPSGFSFSFQSVNGVLYVSEYRDTLSPGAWIELERRTGSGGLETLSDATPQRARRFYRVRVE